MTVKHAYPKTSRQQALKHPSGTGTEAVWTVDG